MNTKDPVLLDPRVTALETASRAALHHHQLLQIRPQTLRSRIRIQPFQEVVLVSEVPKSAQI